MRSYLYNLLIFLCLPLLFCACSDSADYNTLSSEDVLPKAKGHYNYEEDTIIKGDSIESELKMLLQQRVPDIKFTLNQITEENKEVLLPNRLGFIAKDEVYFNFDNVPFHFITWNFEDSIKTINALYNWLDCFGPNCIDLHIEESIPISTQAFVIWINRVSISFLSSTKNINRRFWEKTLFDTLEVQKDWFYILEQPKNKELEWVVVPTKKSTKAPVLNEKQD